MFWLDDDSLSCWLIGDFCLWLNFFWPIRGDSSIAAPLCYLSSACIWFDELIELLLLLMLFPTFEDCFSSVSRGWLYCIDFLEFFFEVISSSFEAGIEFMLI